MGLTGMDCFSREEASECYLAGPATAWVHGPYRAGEALARLRRKPEPFIGSHAGPRALLAVMDAMVSTRLLRQPATLDRQEIPAHLSSYARRIFDQGLGRRPLVTMGANVEAIATAISSFTQGRQADLWAGVGLPAR